MNEAAKKVIAALIDGKNITENKSKCNLILPKDGAFAAILTDGADYHRGLYFLDILKRADQFIISEKLNGD